MTRTPRLPHFPVVSVKSLLLASGLSLFAPAVLPVDVPIDAGIYRTHEALGIGDGFGRFDGAIRLVYDPDGAPSTYGSDSKVLELLAEAYGYWTAVSGVEFVITGVDANALDDRNFGDPDQRDGLVRVSWGAIGGAAGQAGPLSGFYDDALGYFPYTDGTIELNNGADVISSDTELVGVLVHEIGHLLGLGHSDNPDSVMFANPYNFLRVPRADDIRAMQVLYGAPATAIDPDSPLAAWVYTAPPQAGAATTELLFKPNANPASGSGAYFEVNDVTVTSITSTAPDGEFVWFVGGVGGGAAVSLDATFVVVDPSGYVYDERPWQLACSTNSHCIRLITIAEAKVMKTIPGNWKIYVVNKATNETLVSATLPVATTPVFNRAPSATLTAVPGSSPGTADFTLTASDPEGNAIEVIWHPPNLPGSDLDVRQTLASGGSVQQTVDFALNGTHTFFVEVRDDAPRYGDGPDSSAAGEGFQTLLRVTVTLPGATLSVVSTQDEGGSAPSQQLLSAVAQTPNSILVSFTDGVNVVSTADVAFTYGASLDQGATVQDSFQAGDDVVIAGGISPRSADVGTGGDIFMVVRTIVNGAHTWAYRDTSGVFVPWPLVTIATLQPAATVTSLKSSEAFEVFTGNLVPAEHRIYIGYRAAGASTLYYTGQALILTVTE